MKLIFQLYLTRSGLFEKQTTSVSIYCTRRWFALANHFVVSIVFPIFICSLNLHGQNAHLDQDITLKAETFFLLKTMNLNADGTFEEVVTGKTGSSFENFILRLAGDYNISLKDGDNLIDLNFSSIKQRVINGSEEKELKSVEDIKNYNIISSYKLGNFDKHFTLLIEWQSAELTKKINQEGGKITLPKTIYSTEYLARRHFTSDNLKKIVHKKYQTSILTESIELNIISTNLIKQYDEISKKSFERLQISLDKGSDHGIIKGLTLYNNKDGYHSDCDIKIEEVNPKTSIAYAPPHYKFGSQVYKSCPLEKYSTSKDQILNSPDGHYNTAIHNGKFALNKEDYKKALEYFEKAYMLYEKDGYNYYLGALCAVRLEQKSKAIDYIKKAIENNFILVSELENSFLAEKYSSDSQWPILLEDCREKQIKFLERFSKLKDVPFHKIIPFHLNQRWGYFHRDTKEVLLEPQFEKTTFGGSCVVIHITDDNIIQLNENLSIEPYVPLEQEILGLEKPEYPKIVSDHILKGFKVEGDKITEVSDAFDLASSSRYDDIGKKIPSIKGPILINGKNFAIVEKNKIAYVIDEAGKPINKIPAKYKQLILVRGFEGKGAWFYFQGSDNSHGFVNTKGKVLFENQFNMYPFTSRDVAGYCYLATKKTPGFKVLDRATMKIVLEVNDMYPGQMRYTKKGTCKKRWHHTRNEIQEILFECRNGNNFYLLDIRGKEVMPRKN